MSNCQHQDVTEKIGREQVCNECKQVIWHEGELAQELVNLRQLYAITKDELEQLNRR